MLNRFNAISNVSVVEPLGAFYFLVNCEKMGIKSLNLTEKLLSRYQVAAIPGVAFVIDAYAGAIVGWEASASKHTRFVESAIRQAATPFGLRPHSVAA